MSNILFGTPALPSGASVMSTALFNLLSEEMPPVYRDDKLRQEYTSGKLQVQIYQNDGSALQLERLTALKGIFQKQLPKMPREYITRLVYDPLHISVALTKAAQHGQIVGGITYRPFDAQEFAEIVFCAISSAEQVKGFGGFLMSHVKEYVKSRHPKIRYFLTYADNYAVGYFKKQGFTAEISFPREKWAGYIKDYEGGTLMQCRMVEGVCYTEVYRMLTRHKAAVVRAIEAKACWSRVHPGLDPAGFPAMAKDPLMIPGVREAGWRPEMAQLKEAPRKGRLYELLKPLLHDLQKHPAAWPFLHPVDLQDVPDYSSVVTQPMDLGTMQKNLESSGYGTLPAFISDFELIVSNCKAYNAPDTTYVKNAHILEAYFRERLKVRDLTSAK